MSLAWGYQGLPEAQEEWQESKAAAGTQCETSAIHLTGLYTPQHCSTALKPVQHEDLNYHQSCLSKQTFTLIAPDTHTPPHRRVISYLSMLKDQHSTTISCLQGTTEMAADWLAICVCITQFSEERKPLFPESCTC